MRRQISLQYNIWCDAECGLLAAAAGQSRHRTVKVGDLPNTHLTTDYQVPTNQLLTCRVAPVCGDCFISRAGRQLLERTATGHEEEFTFSGVNIYWLGQDENNPVEPGRTGDPPVYTQPSQVWALFVSRTFQVDIS